MVLELRWRHTMGKQRDLRAQHLLFSRVKSVARAHSFHVTFSVKIILVHSFEKNQFLALCLSPMNSHSTLKALDVFSVISVHISKCKCCYSWFFSLRPQLLTPNKAERNSAPFTFLEGHS